MRGGIAPRGFFREGGVERGGSLRRRFEEIVRRAAEAGYPNPVGLYRCTPSEAELLLTSFAADRRGRLERIDLTAWLIGRYAALGWHNPRRYPRRPEAIRPANPEMSDAEMKDALLEFAKGHPAGTEDAR